MPLSWNARLRSHDGFCILMYTCIIIKEFGFKGINEFGVEGINESGFKGMGGWICANSLPIRWV